MIWSGLSHFLIWFHRYFCRRREGFSALLYELCGITGTRCFFFPPQQKAFDYNYSFCEDRCQKQSLSDNCFKLGIHYTCVLFQRFNILVCSSVNNILTNIFPIWARGSSWDNHLPARSLLVLILLTLYSSNEHHLARSLHIMDTFKETSSWLSAAENRFDFFKRNSWRFF